MEMKHTPGPWKFEQHSAGDWLGNIIGSYGRNERGIEQIRTISCQTRYESEPGEALANARLIAAAPDLLAVAQYAESILADVFEGKVDSVTALDAITDLAKPAIAKATTPTTETRA